MEPIQGLNLNRRYISGLEPEMPVTHFTRNPAESKVTLNIANDTLRAEMVKL